MCGVPAHAVDAYIQRLAELGHRVAVCEQVEDSSQTGGRRLVRREVVEVVTPGLIGDPSGIAPAQELVLVALLPGPVFGLAALDASTGDLRATEAPAPAGAGLPAELAQELLRLEPRELLCPAPLAPELEGALARLLPKTARTQVPAESFQPAQSPAFPHGLTPGATGAAPRAAAGLLAFLASHQPFALAQVSRLRSYRLSESMLIDAATRAHLELFSSETAPAGPLIDRTTSVTPLGARRWRAGWPAAAGSGATRSGAAGGRLAAAHGCGARAPGAAERALASWRPSATPRAGLAARVAGGAAGGEKPRAARRRSSRPRRATSPACSARPGRCRRRSLREALVTSRRAAARLAAPRHRLPARRLRRLDALREAATKGASEDAGLEVRERGGPGSARSIGSIRAAHRDLSPSRLPRPTTSANDPGEEGASPPPSCATSSRT
jgi:hypothetical protein